MSEIKKTLKESINDMMLPEVNEYLKELNKLIETNKASPDDLDAQEDMQGLLDELYTILLAIDEDKITDDEAQDVYQNILNLMEESKSHK